MGAIHGTADRGSFLSFTVEIFDGSTTRPLGDFRRLDPAKSAARLAFASPRVRLATVKDRDGALVFACDGTEEWGGDA